jgi:hypothetical protein
MSQVGGRVEVERQVDVGANLDGQPSVPQAERLGEMPLE